MPEKQERERERERVAGKTKLVKATIGLLTTGCGARKFARLREAPGGDVAVYVKE